MGVAKEHIYQRWRAGVTGVVLGVGLIPVGARKAEAAPEPLQSLQNPVAEAYQAETPVAPLVPAARLEPPAMEMAPPSAEYLAVAPTWLPVAVAEEDSVAARVMPDWLKPTEAMSFNPEAVISRQAAVESQADVLAVSASSASAEEGAAVLEIPDWRPSSEQISSDLQAVISPEIRAETDERMAFTSAPTSAPAIHRSYDDLSLSMPAVEAPSVLGRDRRIPRLAISAPGLSDPSQVVYDVRAVPKVAITPAALASAGEVAIAVAAEQVEILTPESGAILNIPSTPVALRFPVGAQIALLVNGQLVDSSLVGRTETDPATQIRIQTWYGIALEAGDNLIEVISTETGQVFASAPVVVRGQPENITLFAPQTLPADGISVAMIRGQLVDDLGIASVWNTTVTLNASDGTFVGADQNPDQPGFQTPVINGMFAAELRASLTSRLVQLQAQTSGFEAFRQIQFVTPQRPSLISGVVDLRFGARGTDFYSSRRDFLPIDGDNRYQLDVDAAVFATGNLGEWLYTGAYNSARSLNADCRGESTLFAASADSSCDSTYPTMGDGSAVEVTAPSLDSVYLRLERNSPTYATGIDYAMWGDFDTAEFATAAQLFTATNRQFHGLKANYNFGNLALTGLYANNVEGFQRDTLAPDGTSGFYFTSERNLVPGSENVYFEVEALERPGSVLERRQLTRGLDYDIDYDRGTLLFSDPVQRTAIDDFGQLLVRRIVATYQYGSGDNTHVVAGRLQYRFNSPLDQPGQAAGTGSRVSAGVGSWVGASYLSEHQGDHRFDLYGVDTRIALGDRAQLIAEIAQSSSRFAAVGNAESRTVTGTAYRLELDGALGDRLSGRVYYRSTGEGFTNSATTSFVPGQTRYGTQVMAQIGETTSLQAQYDHEDNFGVAPQVSDLSPLLSGLLPSLANPPGTALDNSLTTYSAGFTQRIGRGTVEVDWIHRDRRDQINRASNVSSDQLRTRFTTPIVRNLSLVAQNELNLSASIDPIYPSRTLVGLNWAALPWLNVGVNQIFYGGGGNNRGSATSVDVSGEHTFASDTTLRGRLSAIDGFQVGGSIGLQQGINLAPGLDLDLGYEKVFSTLGNATAASTQLGQSVVGNGASALALAGGESYSMGISYSDSNRFQANSRFEHRTSTQGSNTVFNLSAVGRLTPSLTILGDYRWAKAANQNIVGLDASSLLKIGLAYRNLEDDKFNALLRYEHRLNPNTIPVAASFGTSTETQEHLFAAEAIYAPNWRWEFYGKYALRNSSTSIRGAGGSLATNSTVQLAQARATYRLGYQWDVLAEARWLGGNGYGETGFAVETGYYPLPDLRISAGYSAGAANDRDFGNNRSAGGFYVGISAKLSGLLNGFGTQPMVIPPQVPAVVEASELKVSESESSGSEAISPVDSSPVDSSPVDSSPVDSSPVDSSPVDSYPDATEL
ncbi:MAG: TonB-dependent receptor [Phormidesmis sp. RL_2_1]|nr:TonB-dependent receptor [Phormidesmis sp. RL_2_1]